MAGHVQKTGNPETLLKEHFYGAIFENIILSFVEFKAFKKFAKNETTAFCLSKYALNIRKIDKVLDMRIRTSCKIRTRGRL